MGYIWQDVSALRRLKFYNFSQFEMEHSFGLPFSGTARN